MSEVESTAEDRQPLSKMRRAIIASMSLSAQVPQFTLDRLVDVSALSSLRNELRAADLAASWEDLLVAVCARALRSHPGVNASLDEDAIVSHPGINVGIASAVPGGLVSPAIVDADQRSLADLISERKRLREGAANGKLRGVELFGATFTISNLGPYGVDRFRALVIPPQAAILAAGRVLQRGESSSLALTLSCDHRVLDGAPAAEFLTTVRELVEAPDWVREIAPVDAA